MKSMKEQAKQIKAEERKKESERKEALIEAVRNRNVLWDRFLSSHKERDTVEAAWEDVCSETGMQKKDAKSTWKYLKDQFRVNFHAVTVKKSGQEYIEERDISLVKWPYFKQMLFLKDTVAKRCTTSIVDPGLQEASRVEEEDDASAFEILSHLREGFEESDIGEDSLMLDKAVAGPSTENVSRPAKRKRAEITPPPSELDKEISAVELLLKQSALPDDDEEKFAKYLAVLMRRVAPKYKSRCEFKLLETLHEFVEKTETETQVEK